MSIQQPYPPLNLPPVHLRARRAEGRIEIWEPRRGCWLVLTPEEWVRQHIANYLIDTCRIPAQSLVCEYPVPLNGQPQRADMVAVDGHGQPWLLVECKAAGVAIDEKVLAQAVRYNSVLGARHVILTNGLQHYCYRHDNGEYTPCDFSEIQA